SGGVAHDFREHEISLELEAPREPVRHVDLESVVARVAVIGRNVSTKLIRIGEEIHGTVEAVALVKRSQFTYLSGLDVADDSGVRQESTAPQLSEERQRLAPRDIRVVARIERAGGLLRQKPVVLGFDEIWVELADDHLVIVEAANSFAGM